jgi:hypothetical protein
MFFLFDAHIDGELGPLGSGALPPPRFRKVVRHARNCHRCAALYERAIRVLRQLEHRSPWEPAQLELEALTSLNGPVARAKVFRPSMATAAVGLAMAAAVALLLFAPSSGDELTVRGAPTAVPVALRIFCGGRGAALSELKEGAACTAGQSLAFAVGAAPAFSRVVLLVRGPSTVEASVSATVNAQVGAEEAVALTAALERGGEVEVVAAFAGDEVSAAAAARGEKSAGALVLKRVVKVAP